MHACCSTVSKQCTAIAVWSFCLKCHSGVIVRRTSAFEDVVGWVSLGTGMKQSDASPFFLFFVCRWAPTGSGSVQVLPRLVCNGLRYLYRCR